MRKLKNVKYTHSRRLTESQKDEMLIPEKYDGTVALETWEVDGKLVMNYVRVKSVTDYILGYGDFKDVPIRID